jgi:dCMP deaminase
MPDNGEAALARERAALEAEEASMDAQRRRITCAQGAYEYEAQQGRLHPPETCVADHGGYGCPGYATDDAFPYPPRGFSWAPYGPTRKDLQFMKWALAGAGIFSTCSRRQYLAIVTDFFNHVLSIGYNGVAPGQTHCTDGGCPRALHGAEPGSNYDNCNAIHSEQNALIHGDMRNACTLYVNGPPCFTCAKLTVSSGIQRLVYIPDDDYADWPRVSEYLKANGVELVPVWRRYL